MSEINPIWLAKEDKNIGRTWNSLTAVELVERKKYVRKYLFLCSCGNTRIARLSNVQSGQTISCKECVKLAKELRENKSYSDLNSRWRAMTWRCRNLQRYQPIGFCKSWEDFNTFEQDMGTTYFKGAVLDRIDNNKGYSKDNCQWLTKQQHAFKTWEERRDVG